MRKVKYRMPLPKSVEAAYLHDAIMEIYLEASKKHVQGPSSRSNKTYKERPDV
jgi:hypothetical protein